MASRDEILQGLQSIVDEGRESELTDKGVRLLDAARRSGLIEDNRNIIQRTISPQREDIGEFPASLNLSSDPEEALLQVKRMAMDEALPLFTEYSDAVLESDKYGNPVIASPSTGSRAYINTPSFTLQDIPRAISGTMGVVEEVAPYLSAGSITQAARPLVQTAAQGAVGFAQAATQEGGKAMSGEEVDASRLFTVPSLAVLGDVLGRGLFSAGSKIYSKLANKPVTKPVMNESGQFTDEAITNMKNAGVTPKDVEVAVADEILDVAESATGQQADTAVESLSELSKAGKLTAEQAERYNTLAGMGLKPTRAQVTRDASDFQTQQELTKTSTGVRGALEEQEAVLSDAFDVRIRGADGDIGTTGSAITDAITNKAVALDSEISKLYTTIDSSLPNTPVVDLRGFAGSVRRATPEDRLTNGFVKAVRGYAKDQGINLKKPELITVKQAEKLRKYINQLLPNLNTQGKVIARRLKNSIDDDVTRSAGQDFYEQARKAKTDFHQGMSKQARNKFDKNDKSIISDILENKIKPDDVFNKAVLSNTVKADDLLELKNYLLAGSEGQIKSGVNAWSTLRKDALSWIKDASFIGPMDAQGIQALSRDKLQKALDKIGRPKLEALFTKEELKFLDDILKVARLREPVRGTALGIGPSGQVVRALEERVSRFSIPLFSDFVQGVKQNIDVTATLTPARSIQRQMQQTAQAQLPSPAGSVATRSAGAGAATQITGEN
jgi:hypothetical protein